MEIKPSIYYGRLMDKQEVRAVLQACRSDRPRLIWSVSSETRRDISTTRNAPGTSSPSNIVLVSFFTAENVILSVKPWLLVITARYSGRRSAKDRLRQQAACPPSRSLLLTCLQTFAYENINQRLRSKWNWRRCGTCPSTRRIRVFN